MAAIGAVATLLKSGDHVVVTDNTYGGTFRLFDKVLTPLPAGVQLRRHVAARAHRAGAPAEHAHAVRRDADQPGDAADRPGARRRDRPQGATSGWSSTTPSPARTCSGRSSSAPTWSSTRTTKYLNGHSDSIGGIVVATRDDDIEWLRFVQNAEGAILSPFDSWLVLRGTKTLAVRMAQHNTNGLALAEFLRVAPEGPARALPRPADAPAARAGEAADERLRRDAVVRRGHASKARSACCNRVRLMALAESLGGVETLISHPASMTHASVPAERAPGHGAHRQPGADLGGDRGRGRPDRGPEAGARLAIRQLPTSNSQLQRSPDSANVPTRAALGFGSWECLGTWELELGS